MGECIQKKGDANGLNLEYVATISKARKKLGFAGENLHWDALTNIE